MNGNGMKLTKTYYIDYEDFLRLQRYARNHDRSVSSVVVEAIKTLIGCTEKNEPKVSEDTNSEMAIGQSDENRLEWKESEKESEPDSELDSQSDIGQSEVDDMLSGGPDLSSFNFDV